MFSEILNKKIFSLFLATMVLTLTTSITVQSAEEEIVWKMQTVSPQNSKEYQWMPEAFAKNVDILTNGRIKIELHPAGALMGSSQVPEAVSKGVLDCAHTYVSYFGGRVDGFNSASEWPFDAHPLQAVMWFYEGGGQDMMREFGEPHNIFFLGVSPFLPEYVWSKKPVRTIADFEGLKMRAQAIAGTMFGKLGASVVTMAGEEIYPALQRGILDATEYLSIRANYDHNFHEVTDYIIGPTYSGGQSIDWIVNLNSWNELSDDLKTKVEMALKITNFDYWNQAVPDEKQVFEKLTTELNMTYIELPEKDAEKMFEARRAAMKERSADMPDYRKRVDSQMKWAKEALGYGTGSLE
ncbi:MAG: TRAP transporter substrate-binding protein DctP [Desulfobulbaceae bacterium]|nr:TRAP transporter substrate-binding protein DctP [Desulfobulbaceae bacterium]